MLCGVRIIPVERLNALVVVTPRSHILGQVETWIRRLDRPMDALESNLFVYPVQNGSAIHMAEMLNVNRSTISKIERGKFAFTIDFLAKLSWYLKFELDNIFTDK